MDVGFSLDFSLPETNTHSENKWWEDEISFSDGQFSGTFAVRFRECSLNMRLE